uniref:Replication protein n=1 Tax=Acanthis flammea CRESS-DNA-virus sp. TaxID=2815018 RepID=A0A8A4XCP5_9VIRU|nr:MAG: replication protein [Acanthis flammea CRESS-DNA-virus sp.]
MSDKEKGLKEKERFKRTRELAVAGNFTDIPDDHYLRYHSTIKRIHIEDQPLVLTDQIDNLYPWQAGLRDELLQLPDRRKVIWYTDLLGGKGKSEFAKYMEQTHAAVLFSNGKFADMAYILPKNPRIVIIDLVRGDSDDKICYAFIEALKNGRVQSTKYEPILKRFNAPHVVVFSNFAPDKHKLSEDRWDCRDL